MAASTLMPINANKRLKSSVSFHHNIIILVGYLLMWEKLIWRLLGIKKLLVVMNKLIKSSHIVLKESNIILAVYGI